MNALETNTHQHSKDTTAESEFSGNAGKSMMPEKNKYWITTQKVGQAGSAEGFFSEAGSANILESQWV